MRTLALLTTLLFATACGHKQTPVSTPAAPAATTPDPKAGDTTDKAHDDAAEHKAPAKPKDDDDATDDAAKKK